ncbi:hypothetical protein KC19_4G106500 [Ceratodon purpureus]|uniref:Uncharacterized protein n=1 Tax=Ceratodon purpureus TaxID=3225 RepID=A0A8T0I9A8_CERPU|nr:hypothetical protein KC19_4G106500 [Ceratodon purpureus]
MGWRRKGSGDALGPLGYPHGTCVWISTNMSRITEVDSLPIHMLSTTMCNLVTEYPIYKITNL